MASAGAGVTGKVMCARARDAEKMMRMCAGDMMAVSWMRKYGWSVTRMMTNDERTQAKWGVQKFARGDACTTRRSARLFKSLKSRAWR